MKNSHWLDQPANVKLLWRGFLVTLALTVIAGFFVDLHPHFAVEAWPGFYALFGLITCLLMIVVAKLLGMGLKRSDTYYDGEVSDD